MLAACVLFLVLVLIGAGLHAWKGQLFWGGYLALAFFYTIMFYLGLAVARTSEENQVQELLLAGRSLPLGMALLTMTATWVGGGFINGTAESVYSSGLAWAQAPWGYALSLVVGGLITFVVGSAICALAHSLDMLILGRIVQALGACAASVLARAIARDLFDGEALARVLALIIWAIKACDGPNGML